MFSYRLLRALRAPCPSLIALAALSVPLSSAAAVAAAPDQGAQARLTLPEALQRTAAQHPVFAGYRARLSAADARSLQAAIRPAPELGLDVENVLGTGDRTGLSGAETTLSFSQLIERGGLRDRRIDAASAGRSLLSTRGQIARLDVRAEVARRFVHLLSDQAQLVVTREATVLAQDIFQEVQRRVDAARVPKAEGARATVTVARAEIEEEHAEHELLSSRRRLAAAMGSREANFGEAEGDLLNLPPVADFAVLLEQLQGSPDFLRFADESRLRESELRLAQARQSPGLTLGAGVRRMEASDDLGLVFSASLPLFGASQQRGNIAEAEARTALVGPLREQAMLNAQAQLYALWQELNHARYEVQVQQQRVVPAVKEALKQTQYAFERGRYSLLELRDAQAEWATQRRRLIKAAAEFHGYLIEIQRLTGAPAPGLSTKQTSQP